ncbi:uncharacterized protein AFUA_2G10050 [Aspergillus fumigatus Af293]|uniref:Uncharacterized protein n=1 Tax=Aspergillus fumigatus (strain ATCC MYA-4609 / CBS 101355 / FGSC A1100 / Af293) TaxID=330879 RepID=Q4X1G6_ASPFU|nr:hypothetical protein AFUA_2G10050 [Aspergillus fumigatus Af293]EAL93299.2 hypothetical protein AFUA_2G10050 [Aspergillus fumigatus Af293]
MPAGQSPVPTPSPTSRRRAATAMQPSTTPAVILRRPSQGTGTSGISLPQTTYEGSPMPGAGENGRAGVQAPLRHPKPLTPSELHSLVEREQEAMVNRLSRELSMLRQQTASVASTTSSTSTTLNDCLDGYHSTPYLISSAHLTASRRHRSSSSLSSSYVPVVQGSRTGNGPAIARSREPSLSFPSARPNDLSKPARALSTTSRQPDQVLPSLAALIQPQPQQQGENVPSNVPGPQNSRQRSFSPQQVPPSGNPPRQEILVQRGELEAMKRENEALRRRIRDLELVVKKYREREVASPEEPTNDQETTLRLGKPSTSLRDDAKDGP